MSAPAGPDGSEAPPELRRQFVLLVVVVNVALLATALGVLVLVFRSRQTLGVGLVALGFAAAVFATLRYRRVREELPYSE